MRENVQGLKREVTELSALYEIAKVISATFNLETTSKEVLRVMHEHLKMEQGTVTLLDQRDQEIKIHVAHGLSGEEKERGRYRLGEGVTGTVVQTGEPLAFKSVEGEPLFLNKTKARDLKKRNISFICIPIKLEGKAIGALSADCLFADSVSLEEDVRLLTIIGSMLAQAVKIARMIEAQRAALLDENQMLRQELRQKYRFENIIGESKKMMEVYKKVSLVAPKRTTVLLRGESGTGKELIANALHYNSPRSSKPFFKFSCAALPETLLESELFGYEKGAFTGAANSKQGRFEAADGGTLFLDEIGDISLTIQAKLIRVLQEKEFERIGSLKPIKVDVRVIAATHKDLEKAVKEGSFREDLYYRLNVFPIFLPPLRERREDIPLLVEKFLHRFCEENDCVIEGLTQRAWEYVMDREWMGNVRELQNAIERAAILCEKGLIDLPQLHGPMEGVSQITSHSGDLSQAMQALEAGMIKEALSKTGGNHRKAAALLGVTERMINYKIKNNELIKTP